MSNLLKKMYSIFIPLRASLVDIYGRYSKERVMEAFVRLFEEVFFILQEYYSSYSKNSLKTRFIVEYCGAQALHFLLARKQATLSLCVSSLL